jgi:hypothetical protein
MSPEARIYSRLVRELLHFPGGRAGRENAFRVFNSLHGTSAVVPFLAQNGIAFQVPYCRPATTS